MATVVSGLLEKHGGVQGIVAQTEQQGLGGTVKSWVGMDANLPICPAQVHQAFGADAIAALAAKLGVHPVGSRTEACTGAAAGDQSADADRCGAAQLMAALAG
jgi:uncharacterized protein YidB (DUF937 family)